MSAWFRRRAPEAAWVRCPHCAEIFAADLLSRQQRVCPACTYHHELPWTERLELLCDDGGFEPRDRELRSADPLRFRGQHKYRDDLAEASKRTGVDEAVIAGSARLDGRSLELALVEPAFLGGTVGGVAGERLVRALERAADQRVPCVVVAAGGGPRPPDGLGGQVQFARLADRRASLVAAGVVLVSVLVPPLPRGGLLAFATSADVVLAEPVPTGPLGPGSEDLRGAGLVDQLVARGELKATVSRVLTLLCPT